MLSALWEGQTSIYILSKRCDDIAATFWPKVQLLEPMLLSFLLLSKHSTLTSVSKGPIRTFMFWSAFALAQKQYTKVHMVLAFCVQLSQIPVSFKLRSSTLWLKVTLFCPLVPLRVCSFLNTDLTELYVFFSLPATLKISVYSKWSMFAALCLCLLKTKRWILAHPE